MHYRKLYMKSVTIFRYKFFFNFNLGKFPVLNLRPFFAGFIVVFIFTLLSHFVTIPQVQFKKILNTSYKWVNNNSITPKLQKKPNNYKLMKLPQLIQSSLASENVANFLDLGFEKTLGLPAIAVSRDQLLTKYVIPQFHL